VIVRTWTGVVASDRAAEYAEYVRATGVEQYVRTSGCRQALVLTRDLGGGRSEVVALSTWDGEEQLRAFTGPDVDAMVLYAEDQDFLLTEPTLTHHRVTTALSGDPRPADGEDAAMPTPREVAEAFSGHRFRDAYDALAPDIRWTLVGEDELVGRQAVVDACEGTLAELASGTAEFSRFVVVADGDAVAVDTVARYTDGDGEVSVVSSCDVYAFTDGLVTAIRSYAVELPG
jgi:ketosteroid isomerase-like protein